ncbi:MAG: protein-L-isoaspartate(D-aspartate) O-methyltransferase [Tepidisphaeraceae bacterium]
MNHVSDSSSQEQMIREQLIDRGLRDPRVLDAFRSVPRDRFFEQERRDEAFADRAAPIGFGQTISQPYVAALMTQRLDIQPNMKVLEIGTGSGYQSAILSKLAQDVYTIERVKPLLDAAWERLMELQIRNVHFRHGDGTIGWPEEAPFDRMLIGAGAPAVPKDLILRQLADGGLAVMPVGTRDEQMLLLIRRRGDILESDEITPVRFVQLIGREGWPDDAA